MPSLAEIRTEKQLGRKAADPAERAIEESLELPGEIERAQRTVRELIGTGSGGPSWFREENEDPASENARLWRAVDHLATALDLLCKRVETLEH